MKTLTTIFLALAVAAAGAQTTSQSQIRHIETSLNHLTVLEFGESVSTLAIADPDSFQVERHDDKVFVKPLREGVPDARASSATVANISLTRSGSHVLPNATACGNRVPPLVAAPCSASP
jgi:hypothetical protein